MILETLYPVKTSGAPRAKEVPMSVGLQQLLAYREKIGQTVLWAIDPAVRIEVRILDATTAYGHTRFLIQPVAGSGEKWVDIKYLNL